MKPFETLTPEQESILPGVRDEWLGYGLSCEPANRALAEEGVREAYAAAGLEPPKIIVWLDSPMAGALGQAFLQSMQFPDSDQVSDQVRDQVSGQVRGQVWDQVRDQVRENLNSWSRACIWGQHDVGYLAFTAAMQKIGVPKLDAIAGLQKVAQNAGWWWAFKGAVVLTDRPAELHRDKDLRLHNENGPAIRYRDGFGMYLWHGTRVPADLIETGWTTERIFQEKNTEVRRCAIERLGWPEFIESSGMTRVGEPVPDPGNAPHEIALYDLPKNLADMYDEKARILLATNGSPERDGSIHKFGLVVPGHHTDPVAAAADLFGWPRAAYAALEVRR